MKYSIKRFSRKDYEGLDPISKRILKGKRKELAARLKDSRINNKGLGMTLEEMNQVNQVSVGAAKRQAAEFAQKVRKGSEVAKKVGKIGLIGGGLIGGGMLAKKAMETKEFSRKDNEQ